jgi:hypothetical protein
MRRHLKAIATLPEAKAYIMELRKVASARNTELSQLRKALRAEQANKREWLKQLAEADKRVRLQADVIAAMEEAQRPEGILGWMRRVFAQK